MVLGGPAGQIARYLQFHLRKHLFTSRAETNFRRFFRIFNHGLISKIEKIFDETDPPAKKILMGV